MKNKMEENSQNLTLMGYYEGLPKSSFPKKDFVSSIMRECDVSYTTARNWVKGHTRPMSDKHIAFLSKITGIPEGKLWQ